MSNEKFNFPIATSTWFTDKIADEKGPIDDIFQDMKWLSAGGFTHVDANLWHLGSHGRPMSLDNWQDWAHKVREEADRLGLSFHQTHGMTLSGMQWDDPNYKDADFVWEMNYRAIEVTKILGAEWMVMHPWNLPHDPIYSRKRNLESNLSHFAPFIEAAKKTGVGIAIENMVDFRNSRRRYCGGDGEELIELVDKIGDPSVGICVDTGHANVSGMEPGAYIRAVGNRLKAVHINDNFRDGKDAHLLPFEGMIDWADTVKALRDVNYQGDFAFEVTAVTAPKADAVKECEKLYQLGEKLFKL